MEWKWIKADKPIDEYPVGTKYRAIDGGYWTKAFDGYTWTKIENGYKFCSSQFVIRELEPSTTWTGEVMLPEETIIVRLRKYQYTLKKVPKESDLVAGCFGCFFCKKRDGHFRQTCPIFPKDMASCRETRAILKLISKKEL